MTYLTIRKALNKAFLKMKPQRAEIDNFKTALQQLLNRVNAAEHEEFNKNLLSDFLKKIAFEPSHFINTKGRNDLVIHLENDAKSAVGVIIEAKRPDNKSEMLSVTNINAKALQELVLYYLRERITDKNLAIKHLLATDTQAWFVFDAQEFEKHFGSDKKLIKQFTEFENGNLSGINTDFFYKEIAQPAIEKAKENITFTYFDLRQYEKIVNGNDAELDKQLIPLYKILSPEHLLKLPFANDSNSLDKKFYAELLHLIGLEEVEGSKNTIERLPFGNRNAGSLLENTINKLEGKNAVEGLKNVEQFGNTANEQIETIALELVITWVNRILFLKLLEAQLINYHKGNTDYAFLNYQKLPTYSEVWTLFFEILAVKHKDRSAYNNQFFANVPYLNSSLFEQTELEKTILDIGCLRDKYTMPLHSDTVLKTKKGKSQTAQRNTLDYLFAFLNAYDFGSEGTEDIQEQAKTIINAAVLGLIFEKINGYKDGSFFTPGFITMYMCRETLRRAVIQKFNDAKGWNCQTFDDLYNKIEDRTEANKIVNSLKICDPAVGSGHFLVSALNEMIAVKHDLKILQDTDGKRAKEYFFKVENDELIIFDDDGDLFQYNPKNKESLRIQKMLFHEKQTIIENCLFGVDINPNSVKICRLRLWIELLKNAYYKKPDELETLPNIDINIKCGNSLISRFALDTDLKAVLKKNKSKWDISAYRNAVATYRNAEDKAQKREMLSFINAVKSDFQQDIYLNDPKNKQLKKLMGDRMLIENKAAIGDLFEKLSDKEIETDLVKVNQKIEQLEQEIEDFKNNKIYQNAFEWRFEFPEVLNDEGDFVGFDVVIGNPPYFIMTKNNTSKEALKYFDLKFLTLKKSASKNIFNLFIEKSTFLGNQNMLSSMIVPEGLFETRSYSNTVNHLQDYGAVINITRIVGMVFDKANTGNVIFIFNKNSKEKKQEFWFDKNQNINEYVHLSNPILAKLASSNFYQLGDICDLFKGMVVSKRNEYIFKTPTTNLPHQFLLGNCISKWRIDKVNYTNYDTLQIIGGTKVKAKHDVVPKLIIRRTGDYLCCAYLETEALIESTLYGCWSINEDFENLYLMGILHSKLLDYYVKNKMITNQQAFPQILLTDIKLIPIAKGEAKQQPIINLVTQILAQKAADPKADTSELEKEIDGLVYELYGLTEEEIALIVNC